MGIGHTLIVRGDGNVVLGGRQVPLLLPRFAVLEASGSTHL